MSIAGALFIGFVAGFVVAAIVVASLMHRVPLYDEQTGRFEDAP